MHRRKRYDSTGISGNIAFKSKNGYEVLHTQGRDYIVADIQDFINQRTVRLKVHELFDQISFHTAKALQKLHFVSYSKIAFIKYSA
jgi:hypothetical protein